MDDYLRKAQVEEIKRAILGLDGDARDAVRLWMTAFRLTCETCKSRGWLWATGPTIMSKRICPDCVGKIYECHTCNDTKRFDHDGITSWCPDCMPNYST